MVSFATKSKVEVDGSATKGNQAIYEIKFRLAFHSQGESTGLMHQHPLKLLFSQQTV